MARPVLNIPTIAEARKRRGQPDATAYIGELRQIFIYNTASALLDDNGRTALKPTELGATPGAWENKSRATLYYNATAQIVDQIKVLQAQYVPTTNPFEINLSHIGFKEIPSAITIEVLENTRPNADYAIAKIVKEKTTKDKITIDLTRPATGTLGQVLSAVVRITNTPTSLAGITLSIRAAGI